MITQFKNGTEILKKQQKKYETLTSKLISVDRVVDIGATTTTVTLSLIGVDLIVVLISAGVACALSLGNKMEHKLIINEDAKF